LSRLNVGTSLVAVKSAMASQLAGGPYCQRTDTNEGVEEECVVLSKEVCTTALTVISDCNLMPDARLCPINSDTEHWL
jgi:hypothetical protein